MTKGKLLLVDDYQKPESKAIRQLREYVEAQGYSVDTIRHSDAATKIEKREALVERYDLAEGYKVVIYSGGGKRWQKTGETDENGKNYLQRKDAGQEHVSRSNKPMYAICSAFHLFAQATGHKVKNTGKFNRKKDADGNQFNHKYGVSASDMKEGVEVPTLEDVVRDIETFEHAGETLVKSFNIGNKRGVAYHPDRGGNDLKQYLEKYVDAK